MEAEDKQEKPRGCFVANFSKRSQRFVAVPSPGEGSQVFLRDKESSKTTSNPFAMKPSQPTWSATDTRDKKESKPLLAPPKLKLNSNFSKIVLRPSALSIQAEKFVKQMDKLDSTDEQGGKGNSSDESNVAKIPCMNTSESVGKLSEVEHLASSTSISSDSSIITSHSKPSCSAGSTFNISEKNSDEKPAIAGFIFGQNLHERVLKYRKLPEQSSSPTDSYTLTFEEATLNKEELEKMERQNLEEKLKKSLSESPEEYESNRKFDEVVVITGEEEMERQNQEEKLQKSLIECTEEFESKQVKRKFDEVAVITGEEEEQNILQINCKLFAFDKVLFNWQERGRGLLRLNDKECKGNTDSRVVMRIHGSLRVVLNTKVWAGMSVEHPNKKSVRLTAYDPQGVKVFLVMAEPKEAEQLFHALDSRVAKLNGKETTYTQQTLRNDENQSTIEEATSSSNLPDACSQDSYDSFSSKGNAVPDSTCGGAGSHSETNFVPPETSGDVTSDGADDSSEE